MSSLPKAVTEGAAREQAVRADFSALPLGELAFAKQMTERATREQFRIRVNLQKPC